MRGCSFRLGTRSALPRCHHLLFHPPHLPLLTLLNTLLTFCIHIASLWYASPSSLLSKICQGSFQCILAFEAAELDQSTTVLPNSFHCPWDHQSSSCPTTTIHLFLSASLALVNSVYLPSLFFLGNFQPPFLGYFLSTGLLVLLAVSNSSFNFHP